MPSPRWRFREKQRNEVHQEPANTEFFAQQDVAQRLVREAGQNTIDAIRDDSVARLIFTLTESPQRVWNRYFGGLWPHLEAHPELRQRLPNPDAPIPCLLVEDFGTTGLTGPLEPVDKAAAEQNEASHRLFWFFKNVGRTSKTGKQLGSFGIGKTVFPYSSQINTFFGYSVREANAGNPEIVLLGQSQLKEHRLGTKTTDYDPFGFYAWQEGDEASYEQRDISELPLLEDFRADFGLTRGNDETGLSVAIPYPAEGLTRKDLAKAAVVQFFLPILMGQLVVEINQGSDRVELSSQTLLEAIDRFDWRDGEAEPLKHRVRLAKWAILEGNSALVPLNRPKDVKLPKFEETMLPSEQRTALSQAFIAGSRLAFKVPVPVEPKSGGPLWSYVEIFLEYERNSTIMDDIYVRKGLTLVDHDGEARQRGLRSILIAEDGPIYEMLRSSENVAHTKWQQRGADRLKQQYERGPSKISYVLSVVQGLVQALLSPENEADWWTLADLFPEPQPSPLQDRPVPEKEKQGDVGRQEPEPPTEDLGVEVEVETKVRQWSAIPTADGIRVKANPRYEGEIRPMRFRAAYGLLNRQGFGKHDPADFSFQDDKEMIETEGAAAEALEHNVVRIVPDNRDFSIQFKGFDRHRALDYQITTEGE
jgi:hypothetical protein